MISKVLWKQSKTSKFECIKRERVRVVENVETENDSKSANTRKKNIRQKMFNVNL